MGRLEPSTIALKCNFSVAPRTSIMPEKEAIAGLGESLVRPEQKITTNRRAAHQSCLTEHDSLNLRALLIRASL